MKKMPKKIFALILAALLAFSLLPAHESLAQTDTETPESTTPTSNTTPAPQQSDETQEPSGTTTTEATSVPTTPTRPTRPLISLDSYGVSGNNPVKPGQNFELRLTISNKGDDYAENVSLAFSSGDFLPTGTGGVQVFNEIDPGESINLTQRMTANPTLEGQSVATTSLTVTYDSLTGGTSYTETFTITINVNNEQPTYGPAVPTATPTAISRPQLVVSAYSSDVDPLQPGSMFNLSLDVQNLGSADARSVTMVLGGGVTTASGTAEPGDISGGSGDLSTFAPLGSSNLVYLGDIPLGTKVSTNQKLIVNVSANPGAYAFKISFVYDDTQGNRLVNDQVITLLIYQLPQVEISFYQDPGFFYTGQPGSLPLQVNNLGRSTTVLGNMKVTCDGADLTNNVSLVGALDPGGYFPLDVNIIPYQAGTLDITITVNYTDDFNQPREITQTLNVDVTEMPTQEVLPPDGSGMYPDGGGMITPVEETLWNKVVRAFKGLIGLDSAQPEPGQFNLGPTETLPEENGGKRISPPVQAVPIPKG
jgi:hypothetical protein